MAKQTKVQVSSETTVRLVVRGNSKSDGARRRRVFYFDASKLDSAEFLAQNTARLIAGVDMAGGKFSDETVAIYPPVGQLCNGGLSKGWRVAADGTLQRVPA